MLYVVYCYFLCIDKKVAKAFLHKLASEKQFHPVRDAHKWREVTHADILALKVQHCVEMVHPVSFFLITKSNTGRRKNN